MKAIVAVEKNVELDLKRFRLLIYCVQQARRQTDNRVFKSHLPLKRHPQVIERHFAMVRRIPFLFIVIFLGFLANSPAVIAQPWTGGNTRAVAENVVEPAVYAFPLSDVRLLEGPFLQAMKKDAEYLYSLDADRLLYGFFTESGLEPKGEEYAGWERDGLGGHTLGHYLSATSMYYAASGDAEILPRIEYIISEMASVQEARGDGYVAAIPDGDELWAKVRDRDITTSGFRLNGVWAPWYTLHKQFAGLLDAYWNTGNTQALAVAKRLGDWAIATTAALDDADWQNMMVCEYGGMNEALANLYGVTGDDRFLVLSRKFHDTRVLHPLAEGIPDLTGLHANTQIPKIIGVARQYELIGDDSLKTIADFFWEQMVDDHSYVIGGNSMGEFLDQPGKLSDRIDATTAETCNTYNMLRLTRHLFTLEPKARYAEYYERALYNHILASQDPDSGMFTYYMSLKPGHYKTYSTPEGAFWCCVGSGMENHVRYGEAIYFHNDENLYVNLFSPSVLTWRDKSLTLTQETRFPDENTSRFIVSASEPTAFTLHLRHPSWSEVAPVVQINGEAISIQSTKGSYLAINRTFSDGDVIEIALDMRLRLESMPDNPDRVAIMMGPIVLGGTLGTEGMPEGGPFSDSDTAFIEEPTPDVPVLVADRGALSDWIQPLAGDPLTFHTIGAGRPNDIVLKPFYRIHRERYSIYWDLFDEEGWAQQQEAYQAERAAQRAIDEATTEVVRLGIMLVEEEHSFTEEKSTVGVAFGKKFREATPGGWFEFDIAIAPESKNELSCTFWGGDRENREFDILADGELIATQTLDNAHPGEFFSERYVLSESLTTGKDSIRLRFEASGSNRVGRVFECRTLSDL